MPLKRDCYLAPEPARVWAGRQSVPELQFCQAAQPHERLRQGRHAVGAEVVVAAGRGAVRGGVGGGELVLSPSHFPSPHNVGMGMRMGGMRM